MDNQNRSSRTYIQIALWFLVLYGLIHLGFYRTYFIHFPGFKPFQWMHHVHGFLMSTWILMLIIQPLLIGLGKRSMHHRIGKLSYIVAPLIILSMFLITRMSYQKGIVSGSPREAIANQALSLGQWCTFTCFYILAMVYRKQPERHMRYIIGTGLLMILPGLNRLLRSFFEVTSETGMFISSMVTIGIALVLLTRDVFKRRSWIPYTLVLFAYMGIYLLYACRYSDLYQAIGTLIARVLP
jgi:hypothetical protein